MTNTNKQEQYVKSLNRPDDRRDFKAHGHLDLIKFSEDLTVGRAEFEPGWKWENDVKPIAGTSTCEAAHTGYCQSGAMTIQMTNGDQFTVKAGDAFHIPPGHTAWVEGKEKCVMIDVGGFKNYAMKPGAQTRAA
ncbi:MAG: cupin domain-containing protein [Bdellovibrionota bacterium]